MPQGNRSVISLFVRFARREKQVTTGRNMYLDVGIYHKEWDGWHMLGRYAQGFLGKGD